MKKYILLMLAMLTAVSFTAVGQKKVKKDLSGQTFVITLKLTSGKKSGYKWESDEITFRGKKLNAKEIGQHDQFADAACKVTKDTTAERTFTFEAIGKNPKGAEIKWEGTVEGDNISGTAVWTAGKKGSFEYSFEGELKGADKPKGKK